MHDAHTVQEMLATVAVSRRGEVQSALVEYALLVAHSWASSNDITTNEQGDDFHSIADFKLSCISGAKAWIADDDRGERVDNTVRTGPD